jgi:branched-chain amino acid transport system permease protein
MTSERSQKAIWLLAAAAFVALAFAPLLVRDYWLSFLINTLCYVALATAWRIFSGPTRYFSLAVAAFFGIGAYVVAVSYESVPLHVSFVLAGVVGTILALIVGATTLRVSGIHFVIFTFGLTELIRELAIWWEINQTKTVGRYVLIDFSNALIYLHLLALTAIVFVVGYFMERSKVGSALRIIGEDETVADQCGINRSRIKIFAFVVSAVLMTLVGAIMAPRWSYIAPNTVFNAMVSFQVVIMALLGGMQRLWGPVLGVIPMIILSEFLSTTFPRVYAIILGAVFLLIVYFLPHGIAGVIERLWHRFKSRRSASRSDSTGTEGVSP